MSSFICWCHVFLGRPRRLVPGIASSITLRVTLFTYLHWTCLVLNAFLHTVGQHCETNIDDCTPDPCRNGRCVDRVDGYTCVCQPQYVGVNCAHHVCDESTSPCLNGGTCFVTDNKARCKCLPAFAGDLCEREKCLNVTCLNEGACLNGICICQQGKNESNMTHKMNLLSLILYRCG